MVATGFSSNIAFSADSGKNWKQGRIQGRADPLKGVAPNRMPDLAVSDRVRMEGCTMSLVLSNFGPSWIRSENWPRNEIELRVSSGGKTLFQKGIAEWDSGRMLQKSGGSMEVGGIQIPAGTTRILAEIIAPSSFREMNKTNNRLEKTVSCKLK